MVTICQQCGDKGWKVALIYCGRCINFAVHRYCLPKIPPTFDEFVHWVCEDCGIKRMLKIKSLPLKSSPILSTKGDDKRKETCLDTEEIKEKVDDNIQDSLSPSQFHVDQIDEGESNNKRKESCSDTEKINEKSDERIQDTPSPSQSHVDQIDGEGGSDNKQKESCSDTEKINEKSDENIQDTPSPSKFNVDQIVGEGEGESNHKQKESSSDTEIIYEKSDENIQDSPLPSQIPEAPTTPTESEVKIANDAVDSKTSTDENKDTQTPDKETKKAKKKIKSPIYGNRKRRKGVGAVAKKQEETEEVDPAEHAEVASDSSSELEAKTTNDKIDSEPKTDENKISQTPNSEKKKKRKRKSPIYGSRKKRKAVSTVAEKQEETVEVIPTELVTDFAVEAKVKIANDRIESKPESEENKASQTPNSETKKQKKKRKSTIYGHRKRRKVDSPASKKKEETEKVDPTEHADQASDHTIESEADVANDTIDSNPAVETQEVDPTEHAELASDPRVESGVKIANVSVDSISEPEGNKTLQTPNSANKKPKRKRKSSSYGKQKKRNAVNPAAKKLEETEELDPTEHTELATDSSPVNECQPSNEKLPSVPVCTEKTEKQILVVSDNGRQISQVHNSVDYIPINSIGIEHAKPVINPIWRGNFSTAKKEYNIENGVAAHLSNKACPKVWEEAKLFSNSLYLEMHPKSEIWPKSFQLSPPSDDSIALYFFPADKSYEVVFNQLIEELMRKEIAMRATVQNAELLIFASMELPFSHWRFQGKHYLWGVFRGKQQR